MPKAILLKTAAKLKQPKPQTTLEFSEKKDLILTQINARSISRQDILEMAGNNFQLLQDNHANHLKFMESTFMHYNPKVFVESILWVFKTYRSRNFNPKYWSTIMNSWLNVHKQNLSEESFFEIQPFYTWMQRYVPLFNKEAEQSLAIKVT